MNYKNVYETIKKEIVELYGDLPMQDDVEFLAKDLAQAVVGECASAADFSEIYDFESELVGLDYSKYFYLMSTIVDLIPIDEIGTKKLYDVFMETADINALTKLVAECRKFLSDEQYQAVRERAKCYDENILQNIFGD